MPSNPVRLKGQLRVPGDKSISHRALIFSALTEGTSHLEQLSPAEDVASTMSCLRQLGLTIEAAGENSRFTIHSPGFRRLAVPKQALEAGNSGTTMRLISGLVAGQPFSATLDGDDSLRNRPMSRVLEPLSEMGAKVSFKGRKGHAPFSITGGRLSSITFQAQTASAQVQTALLLAGLQADGETAVSVPGKVRDHTVRLFRHIGIPYRNPEPATVRVSKLVQPLPPFSTVVPGDISSAAFFMVAAALLPGSQITLRAVGINPGRRLVLDVLRSMGAEVAIDDEREISGEPVADLALSYTGRLKAATIDKSEIAAGIDEIPVLALAGALGEGLFTVRGAAELKVKESDRLSAIVANLRGLGASVTEYTDGFEIEGQKTLPGGATWRSFGDHRLAMTGLIASLVCAQPVEVDDLECLRISYPSFQQELQQLLCRT